MYSGFLVWRNLVFYDVYVVIFWYVCRRFFEGEFIKVLVYSNRMRVDVGGVYGYYERLGFFKLRSYYIGFGYVYLFIRYW